MQFLDNAGKAAGAISAILALLGLVFFTPVKNRIRARRQAREKAAAEQKAFRKELKETLAELNAKLCALSDDIGDLQYERLSQAHDFYVGRGWCPTSKKNQLCQMYKSYTAKGRNHLSKYYEQEILALAEEPQERSEST